VKTSKFVSFLASTLLLLTPSQAVAGKFETLTSFIGELNNGDVDQVCKNIHSSAYVSSFNPDRSATVCIFPQGIEVGVNSGGSCTVGFLEFTCSVNWGNDSTTLKYDVNQSVNHDRVCLHKYQSYGYSDTR
jgi:hypothetical protein